jgi:hypothetical protein
MLETKVSDHKKLHEDILVHVINHISVGLYVYAYSFKNRQLLFEFHVKITFSFSAKYNFSHQVMEADAGREHSTNGEKITTHVVLV